MRSVPRKNTVHCKKVPAAADQTVRVKNKRIDFKPMISKIYSVDDAVEAFEANKAKDTIKILIAF